MALYRRILLATDLSEGAIEAARAAARLAAPDARGTGLMVLPPPDLPTEVPPALLAELLDASRNADVEARDTLADWLRRAGVPKWGAEVEHGPPARTIAERASKDGTDLLVLGTTGSGFLQRLLLGSTARSALHRATCDTLLARRVPEGPLRRIVVATDLQAPSEPAARRALDIARKDGAALTLVHAIDPGDWSGAMGEKRGADWMKKFVMDRLTRFNRSYLDGEAREVVAHGRPHAVIAEEARDADLIVVGTHGGGALTRTIIGSVAEAVAERAHCSVLVVRKAP